jgi:hypothetical protein
MMQLIVVGNRLGRKGNRETQVIILKWIAEELLHVRTSKSWKNL